MKRILCIWFPNWPIQRLVVERPELSCQRIILFRQHAQRGQLVSAASSRALAAGVALNMPLSEAKSLCEKVRGEKRDERRVHAENGVAPNENQKILTSSRDGLHFFEQEPELDNQALETLALTCEPFSPIIGLEQVENPSSIFLDVSGLAHLFHGERQLCVRISEHLRQHGYFTQLAIAPTVAMAWGTARFADEIVDQEIVDQETCQPIMDDEHEKNGERAVDDHQIDLLRIQTRQSELDLPLSAFDSLPTAALRLLPNTIDTLEQLGVTRIDQISQLPREGLRSRFGDEITIALDRASGVCEEVIVALQRPVEFSAEKFLDYPISDRETVEVILSRLISKLCEQMRSQQRGALTWHFVLTGPHQSRLDFQVNLFQPAASSQHVMQLVKMQLEQNQNYARLSRIQSRRKIRQILTEFCFHSLTISIPGTVLLTQRQTHLFDADAQPSCRSLSHLVNTLCSRLGQENVLQAHLQAGASAENASRFEMLVGQSDSSVAGKTRVTGARAPSSSPSTSRGKPPAFSPLERPLRLFPEPAPLQPLFEIVSETWNHPRRPPPLPAAFAWNHRRIKVHRRWGPERIETRWWNCPTSRRDYWRIETDDGRWLWVFHNLRNKNWYVHGEF